MEDFFPVDYLKLDMSALLAHDRDLWRCSVHTAPHLQRYVLLLLSIFWARLRISILAFLLLFLPDLLICMHLKDYFLYILAGFSFLLQGADWWVLFSFFSLFTILHLKLLSFSFLLNFIAVHSCFPSLGTWCCSMYSGCFCSYLVPLFYQVSDLTDLLFFSCQVLLYVLFIFLETFVSHLAHHPRDGASVEFRSRIEQMVVPAALYLYRFQDLALKSWFGVSYHFHSEFYLV